MRTVTVKGVGQAVSKAELVVITLQLKSLCGNYEEALQQGADKLEQVNCAWEGLGFDREAVKTTRFYVEAEYRNVKQKNGEYAHVFEGYACHQSLKLEFDFEPKTLGKMLGALGNCAAHADLSVAFAAKSSATVEEELLVSATVNARKKAEILCRASGVKLGNLISVDYSWGEINLFSHTEYDAGEGRAPLAASLEFHPEDIQNRDTATFVWEIE